MSVTNIFSLVNGEKMKFPLLQTAKDKKQPTLVFREKESQDVFVQQ